MHEPIALQDPHINLHAVLSNDPIIPEKSS